MTKRAANPLLRFGTFAGLIGPAENEPRSRWARIVAPEPDSSAPELLAGLVVSAALVTLVFLRTLRGPLPFQVLAVIATLGLAANFVRIVVVAVRRLRAPNGGPVQ